MEAVQAHDTAVLREAARAPGQSRERDGCRPWPQGGPATKVKRQAWHQAKRRHGGCDAASTDAEAIRRPV